MNRTELVSGLASVSDSPVRARRFMQTRGQYRGCRRFMRRECVMGRTEALEKSKSAEKFVIEMPTHKHGPVMAIGGAEDRTDDGEILGRFVDIAGGARARILVIPTASENPTEAGQGYIDAFGKHGVKHVDIVEIEERAAANDPSLCEQLKSASGVFITGGDQS